jgi:hypothetical protein
MDSGILMIQDSILVCSPDPRIPHTAKERAGGGNPPALSPKIFILVLVIHTTLSPNMSSWRCS